MVRRSREETKATWRARVNEGELFDGGPGNYCRSKGIALHAYYRWRTRFRAEGLPPTSAFVSVVLPEKLGSPKEAVARVGLPEPKWLAETLYHLTQMLNR